MLHCPNYLVINPLLRYQYSEGSSLQIFEEFTIKLDKWAKCGGRKIMLLADNAPSHKMDVDQFPSEDLGGLKCIRLPNVLVVFLPPNTTSHVQPLDAGIIRTFKAYYRRKLLTWLIQLAEEAESSGVAFDISSAKASVKQVRFSIWKWEWRERSLLPKSFKKKSA